MPAAPILGRGMRHLPWRSWIAKDRCGCGNSTSDSTNAVAVDFRRAAGRW